jgi:hypothetical protein
VLARTINEVNSFYPAMNFEAGYLAGSFGSAMNAVAVSDERNAHFIAIAPNDPALSDELFGNDHKS